MPEGSVAPLWTVPLLPVVLLLLGAAGAATDAALGTRLAGRRVDLGTLVTPLREALRLLLTQRTTTRMPDAIAWRVGGGTVAVAAVVAAGTVPLAPGVVVADLPTGLVWWTAFMALLWVGVYLLGWGANSAHALVGGYRFVAQALAYEMPLAITVVTVGVLAESLQLGAVAAAQSGAWFAIAMPAGFAVYLVCAAAIAFYGPFATPVGADLAGGPLAELAGVDRLLVVGGRWLVLASTAAFAVPLFLGGGAGPLLPDVVWSLLKALGVLVVLVAARWGLPHLRMDRFEEVAWAVGIPLTFVQLAVVCTAVLARAGP